MPPSGKELAILIAIELFLLCSISLIVSLAALIPPIREEARQNSVSRKILALSLGIIAWGFAFWEVTRYVSQTSDTFLPHGVEWGVWDDFENEESGSLFYDAITDRTLYIDDSSLFYISKERLQRYLRPPFLRHRCYTGAYIGCRWADIDIDNFQDDAEWFDYFFRLGIGIIMGALTGALVLWYTTEKSTNKE